MEHSSPFNLYPNRAVFFSGSCFNQRGRVLITWTLLIFITCITTVRPQLRTDTSRSSTISTTDEHVLKGHAIHKQQSYDFLSCAHLCLARSNCGSCNYENIRNGMCELNARVSQSGKVDQTALTAQRGYSFGQFVLQNHPMEYIFTTLGARGANGPSSTSGYVGTPLEDQVSLNNGIQIWTVPVTGSYVIEAFGGSGANGTIGVNNNQPAGWRLGGLGAKITGTFQLFEGTQLKILVGQEGGTNAASHARAGGGGGGSFVTLWDNTPLIIAGGGGGGGLARDKFTDGDPGQATRNGTQCGGTDGNGGRVCNADTGSIDSSLHSGGGAGFKGNGEGASGAGVLSSFYKVPLSFINGGKGGTFHTFVYGGFGGGSFAHSLGGGGGGYSGGGVMGTGQKGTAGGGGSYNDGINQQNLAGVNKGDGKVIITLLNS